VEKTREIFHQDYMGFHVKCGGQDGIQNLAALINFSSVQSDTVASAIAGSHTPSNVVDDVLMLSPAFACMWTWKRCYSWVAFKRRRRSSMAFKLRRRHSNAGDGTISINGGHTVECCRRHHNVQMSIYPHEHKRSTVVEKGRQSDRKRYTEI